MHRDPNKHSSISLSLSSFLTALWIFPQSRSVATSTLNLSLNKLYLNRDVGCFPDLTGDDFGILSSVEKSSHFFFYPWKVSSDIWASLSVR